MAGGHVIAMDGVWGRQEDLVARVRRLAVGYLEPRSRDERVLAALTLADRAVFLPTDQWAYAYEDRPLPIGAGQTCSQPSMVAFMLDKLELAPGLALLEVGSGSGWALAVAALLCGPGGRATGCEIIPELAAGAREKLENWRRFLPPEAAARLADCEVLAADASGGLPDQAPFDRILLSAGVTRGSDSRFDPALLLSQLRPGGILLYPESSGRLYRVRLGPDGPVRDGWDGVAFVPLRGAHS